MKAHSRVREFGAYSEDTIKAVVYQCVIRLHSFLSYVHGCPFPSFFVRRICVLKLMLLSCVCVCVCVCCGLGSVVLLPRILKHKLHYRRLPQTKREAKNQMSVESVTRRRKELKGQKVEGVCAPLVYVPSGLGILTVEFVCLLASILFCTHRAATASTAAAAAAAAASTTTTTAAAAAAAARVQHRHGQWPRVC